MGVEFHVSLATTEGRGHVVYRDGYDVELCDGYDSDFVRVPLTGGVRVIGNIWRCGSRERTGRYYPSIAEATEQGPKWLGKLLTEFAADLQSIDGLHITYRDGIEAYREVKCDPKSEE